VNSTVSDWHSGWAAWGRRIGAAPGAVRSRDLTYAPAVAGILLGLAAAAETLARAAVAGTSGPVVAGVLILALLSTVPLALPAPVPAALAISSASVLSLAVFQTLTVAGACAQLIALYRLGVAEPRSGARRNWARLLAPVLALPFPVLAVTGLALTAGRHAVSEEGILTVLLAALAPAAALGGIARRASLAEQAHRAERQVIADTLFDHMARGERARIARELHDVVAHHISMIAVQAETARLATPGMPAAGAQRLLEIGNTARAGLTEMRRLLGVLREDAQAASPSQLSRSQLSPGRLVADRRPQPGLQQLNELIDEARDAAGTGVRFIVSGSAASLDPGVELAAYRIVQEGLTNARRHAPGAAVDVELRFTDDTLRLRIRDNGPGPRETGGGRGLPVAAGHGLTGMRERAAAAGGKLRTGAARGGGFLIEATLPANAEADG
jgi:signal transduction histidine kinase